MNYRIDDYIDADVSYLIGLIIGRGSFSESHGIRQISINFSYSSLEIQGVSNSFDQSTFIKLGLNNIRERLLDLLNADISIISKRRGIELVIRFLRNSMAWRNILLFTQKATSFHYFEIPKIFFDTQIPKDWKREFVRGYADVAGNIRVANRYVDGRNRVRLDVLNHPSNWKVPVQLCTLLQEGLDIPVQLITWGHPNLGRDFREHQVNIFAKPFLQIGFSFEHKQQILEEFARLDDEKNMDYKPCPGMRIVKRKKPKSVKENDKERLDSQLVGKHYDAYWQICKDLGCKRIPPKDIDQIEIEEIIDDEE